MGQLMGCQDVSWSSASSRHPSQPNPSLMATNPTHTKALKSEEETSTGSCSNLSNEHNEPTRSEHEEAHPSRNPIAVADSTTKEETLAVQPDVQLLDAVVFGQQEFVPPQQVTGEQQPTSDDGIADAAVADRVVDHDQEDEWEEFEEEVEELGPEEEVMMEPEIPKSPEPAWCDAFTRPSLLKGKDADRQKVLDLDFAVSVSEFWELFFSDSSVRFVSEYHSKRGDTELVVPHWEMPHPKFGSYREKKFRSPVNAPMAPPSTRSVELQKYSLAVDRLHIETTQSVLDIPYGDHFVVETYWKIEPSSSGAGVHLTLTVGLFFHKSTMFKGKITSQTTKESAESFKLWATLAHATVDKYQAEQAAKRRPRIMKIRKPIKVIKKTRRRKQGTPSTPSTAAAASSSSSSAAAAALNYLNDQETVIPTSSSSSSQSSLALTSSTAVSFAPAPPPPTIIVDNGDHDDNDEHELLTLVDEKQLRREVSESVFIQRIIPAASESSAELAIATGTPHVWKAKTFKSPTWCARCGDFIWGAWKQGKMCTVCCQPGHHKCAETALPDCDQEKHDHAYWCNLVQQARDKSGVAFVVTKNVHNILSTAPTPPRTPMHDTSSSSVDLTMPTDTPVADLPDSASTESVDFVPAAALPHIEPEALAQSSSSSVVEDSIDLAPHDFHKHTFKKPTWCIECGEFIWGAVLQGKRCKLCEAPVHHKCVPKTPSCTREKKSFSYWKKRAEEKEKERKAEKDQ